MLPDYRPSHTSISPYPAIIPSLRQYRARHTMNGILKEKLSLIIKKCLRRQSASGTRLLLSELLRFHDSSPVPSRSPCLPFTDNCHQSYGNCLRTAIKLPLLFRTEQFTDSPS